MDYSLVGLIVLMILTIVIATKHHRRSWPGRRGSRYQQVFSIGAIGLWLTVAGAIGWDVRHVRGVLGNTRWVTPPIWWQLGVGLGLVAVAVFLARRVPSTPRHVMRTPPVRR